MHRIIAAVLAATTCAAAAHSQDTSAPLAMAALPTFSLEDAVAAAGGSAPAIEAAEAGVSAAQAGRRIAGLRPNPTVSTQVENVIGSGPYRGFSQAETTVSLAVPIELGGKRSARVAVADAQTRRAELSAAITQADVRLQVTQLYIDTVAAKWRAFTARDQAQIAEDAFSAARIRVQAGRASPIEEQRAEVARLNAQAGAERAQRLADAAAANLERRIGRQLNGNLDMTALDKIRPVDYGSVKTPDAAGTLALAAAEANLRRRRGSPRAFAARPRHRGRTRAAPAPSHQRHGRGLHSLHPDAGIQLGQGGSRSGLRRAYAGRGPAPGNRARRRG